MSRNGGVGRDAFSIRSSTYRSRPSVIDPSIPLELYSSNGIWQGAAFRLRWEVEYTDEFEEWWNRLTEGEQDAIAAVVGLLENKGPYLPFPYSSGIATAGHAHMRELRIQYRGHPYRVLYAFDPRRIALLLLGGCKVGNGRWYVENVPIADRLYDEHLKTLESEEKGNG